MQEIDFVSNSQIKAGVSALKTVTQVMSKQKKTLFTEEQKVNLEIVMFHIPQQPKLTIKLHLPHRLYVPRSSRVCLFVGDLNKREDPQNTVNHFLDLLKAEQVESIDKVITAKQLKTEYKPHEAKRHLFYQFDIFLTEAKIKQVISGHLGKEFFLRKRQPISVVLDEGKIFANIDKALSQTYLHVTNQGPNVMVKVGHWGQSEDEVVENVMEVCRQLQDKFPGGWRNIKTMSLKGEATPRVPIYVSLEKSNSVPVPSQPKVQCSDIIEEVSTLGPNRLVSINPETLAIKVIQKQKDGSMKEIDSFMEDEDMDSDIADNIDDSEKSNVGNERGEEEKMSDDDDDITAAENVYLRQLAEVETEEVPPESDNEEESPMESDDDSSVDGKQNLNHEHTRKTLNGENKPKKLSSSSGNISEDVSGHKRRQQSPKKFRKQKSAKKNEFNTKKTSNKKLYKK